ncbi:DEAD/DEAH box helicase [Sabulicella rubraurantiaca]|uniref:DEAD/DEAH box helicase n=1 Tax=Sabulicella rubraurantiaca TaxID=2811429 RepID=UPI001A9622A6|nr:DEAD/DEAH box helicase [Sabulicella rubraurantiaca]
MTNFAELGLDPLLLQALAEAGHETPTPIQAQAIPAALQGRDVLGIAQTGTGKTAAFALPILHRLKQGGGRPPRGGCRVLVLSPTRELASQIADSFKKYGKHLGFSTEVVFGGVGHVPQQKALARGVDVLVATPGRLLDHMGTRHARLDHVEVLVLDEADQMLDKGFLPPIRKIVAAVPQRQQTMFFSATMPTDIANLARDMLRDPVRVEVTPVATTAERVNQRAILLEPNAKRAMLAKLLRGEGVGRTLIFSRTKHGADKIVKALEQDGLSANAIHGNKGQSQRERALAEFKSGRAPILVATDIAARGIDVREVTHVIQHDLPEVPETYVHRIGRTARAGAEGEAVALVAPDELGLLRAVERLTRQSVPMEDQRADKSGRLDDRATPVRPQRGPRPGRGGDQQPSRKPQQSQGRHQPPAKGQQAKPQGQQRRPDAPRGGEAPRRRPGDDSGRVFMARGR